MIMKQKDVAKQLFINLAQCEPEVQGDIIRRVADWVESGGDLNDPYIENQLQYTNRHLELLSAKKKFDNKHGVC